MIIQPKKETRSRHRTQWAAQFAVASELVKRGYEVAFTTGNHPMKDLLVVSPKGIAFSIDVKGLYTKNVWPVNKRSPVPNLFYVFAYVPNNKPNRYFILTQGEVNIGIEAVFNKAAANKAAKGEVLEQKGYFNGVAWKYAEEFDNWWTKLPK